MSKKNKEKKPPVVRKTLTFMIKVAKEGKKGVFWFYALDFLGNALGELKNLLLPKLLVDELVLISQGASAAEHFKTAMIYAAITVAAEFVSRIMINTANSVKSVYRTAYDLYLEERLTKKSTAMDFQYTEDPAVLDQQEKAKTGISWYSGGVMGVLDCLYNLIYGVALMVTVIVIIAIYCPLLLPVQIIGMGVITYFNYKKQLINTKFFMKLSKLNRIFGYIFYEMADFRYGKDFRLYDSVDMMYDKAAFYSDEMTGLWSEQAGEQYKNDYKADIANAVRDAISYFYMGFRAITKKITLGEFTLCVQSASKLYQSLFQIGNSVQQINEKCNYAYQYLVFEEYPDAIKKGTKKVEQKDHVIEFKDVSFKYPRAEEYVLEHVNIKIDSKEHLSIVGLNGAGKTTFIKLLCRLYEVTDGEILIDGININDYSEEEYRKLFSVVFQDFMLFAFSLKENICMGDVTKTPDDQQVEEVLKLSGLYEDAMGLDKGIDTILYKSFDEKGTELSGGQKQKAAISRALYKNAPIVILDEPTAALDPIAEYEIYKKFDTLVGNKAAIYISHRLSSCKFCDKIAVFAEKTIKEYGTHDELVKKEKGIYAEMFAAQAQYYVEAGNAV